jgi:DNA-binding IclR family transcriptional regulator
MSDKNGVRGRILKILKKHPEGLTILDIAGFLELSRITIAKYIYGLAIEGAIRQRQVGSAKLCYLCGKYVKK